MTETNMLTKAQREDAKEFILRMLRRIDSGESHLGDDGGITNLELSEILGWIFFHGTTQPMYVYDLLKVLRSHGWVERQLRAGHRLQWRITPAGLREIRRREREVAA